MFNLYQIKGRPTMYNYYGKCNQHDNQEAENEPIWDNFPLYFGVLCFS